MFSFLPDMGLDTYNRLSNLTQPTINNMPWLGQQDPTLQGPAAQVQNVANPLSQLGLLGGQLQQQGTPQPQPMAAPAPVGGRPQQAMMGRSTTPVARNTRMDNNKFRGLLGGYL